MVEGLVGRLADFAAAAHRSGLPDEVAAASQRSILDTIGVAVAAAAEDAVSAAGIAATRWAGTAEATVLVTGERLPAASAALVNGTMAHALDFDDTHLPSVLHPSASVVPTALAVAEQRGASLAQAVRAATLGSEITCRLGMAAYDPELRNSIFFERGLHATSICGTLGSAATASLLMDAAPVQVANAMAIAASMGAGLLEANRTGGTVKRIHCGWAAHSGIVAAQLAAAGLTGPPTVLEGRFGFFAAYTGGWFDPAALTEGLGDRWESARLFAKPYPTNHFTHAGIDAALALRAAGLDPAEISEITLGVPSPVLRTIAEPAEEKARPASGYQARFSGPFTVASALLGGGGLGVSLADFTDDTVHDSDRLQLASLVRCVADDEATATFPHQFGGIVRVRTKSGRELEHRIRYSRGGPEHPLSAAELAEKFRLNADPVLGADRATHVVAALTRPIADGPVADLMTATVT